MQMDMKNKQDDIRITMNLPDRESYWQLVWRKFKKSPAAMVGAALVLSLLMMALFPDFFTPSDSIKLNIRYSYHPPQRVRFIDVNGRFSLRPFVYGLKQTLDLTTMTGSWTINPKQKFYIRFFVPGYEYKILGLFNCRLHLYGVGEHEYFYVIGADKFGRDLWGRICQGSLISLSMSLFGTLISVVVGASLGIISGYYGGKTDNILQRFIEFIQSFPQLPLWMALAAVIPNTWSQLTVFIMMSLLFAMLSWALLAREVRGKVLSMREADFILAAKEMGASDRRIIFYHLLPNNLSQIIVMLTLTVPTIILSESFLSFLGIGIQEPLVSWGTLMREAQTIQTLGAHLWITLPVVFILFAVLGFNFLGDGFRDAADPYTRH